MKKSTKTNIILTVAVVLAAALVAGVFTALFIDRSPVEDTPSDVVDVPDIPDTPDNPDDWHEVPDSEGEFTVLYGAEMTFTPESTAQLLLPQQGSVLFQVTGTSAYTIKVVSNIDDGQGGSRSYYYMVDGKLGLFSNDDYTEQFIKSLSASSFFFIEVQEPGYYDLENVLSRIYSTDNIQLTVPEDLQYPYKMVVTSAEGEQIIIELGQSN